jgi:type IV secretory pathway VirJ component
MSLDLDDIGYPNMAVDYDPADIEEIRAMRAENATLRAEIDLMREESKNLIKVMRKDMTLREEFLQMKMSLDSLSARQDASTNNCNYLYEQFNAITTDHNAMLQNCQKMIPIITMVTEFMNAYRPILDEVQGYLDDKWEKEDQS